MGKLPRSVVKKIARRIDLQSDEVKIQMFKNKSKISIVKEKTTNENSSVFEAVNIVRISLGSYSLYNFPNLGLWVKARPDLVNELEGYQPEYNALRPVDETFVSKVLSAKIQGILNL